MIRSMTGFGRGIFSKDGREYLVEIKTVNHRYLDVSIKLARTYNYLECKVREALSKRLFRGKVDVSIWIDDFGTSRRTIFFDEGLADLYVESLNKIKQKYDIGEEIGLSLISGLPDVFKLKKEQDDENLIWNELNEALTQAIEALILMREREGLQLKNDILEKTKNLDALISRIEARAPIVVDDYRTKLQNRVKDILENVQAEESRLELEIALFADRCSIEEELTRFKSHIKQLNQALESIQPVGRKLDFLVQEMNREINTMGSKANDLEITNTVLEVKSEIEKIREQIQNVE